MKIFVTGATGFIGTHLCRRLTNDGHEVTALLRSPKKKHLLPESSAIIEGDLSIFKDPDLKLPPFDFVYHLAGVIHAKDDEGFMKHNYHAVRELVECIDRQGWTLKRFLFASSLAAAGPSQGATPLREEDPLQPVDPYGDAKRLAEEYLLTQNIPSTSFRPAIVLGPGDENSYTLFKMAKRGLGVKVAGLDQLLSFVDIDDLIDGMIKMMDEEGDHQQYFVAHPDPVTIPELWQTIGKGMGKKVRIIPIPKFLLFSIMKLSGLLAFIFPFNNQMNDKQYTQMTTPAFVCSGEKLSKSLDWHPKHDIAQTVKKAIKGYKELGQL